MEAVLIALMAHPRLDRTPKLMGNVMTFLYILALRGMGRDIQGTAILALDVAVATRWLPMQSEVSYQGFSVGISEIEAKVREELDWAKTAFAEATPSRTKEVLRMLREWAGPSEPLPDGSSS